MYKDEDLVGERERRLAAEELIRELSEIIVYRVGHRPVEQVKMSARIATILKQLVLRDE